MLDLVAQDHVADVAGLAFVGELGRMHTDDDELIRELRFEAFGATNTPHFNAPNGAIGNKNAGKITGAGGWRAIQLGIKYLF